VKLRLHRPHDGDAAAVEASVLELDEGDLRRLSLALSSPSWLRDLGLSSWFLVGFLLLLGGIVWLLGVTATIVNPVVSGLIVATVASPVVAALERHMRRSVAAVLVLLALLALAVAILVLVIGGIVGQSDAISSEASAAAGKAQGWLTSVGVSESGASSAKTSAESGVPNAISTLLKGVINGIAGIASLVFGLSLTLLSVFFLLKDGPPMRRWVDRHLGLPLPVAQTITGGVLRSLRGYFRGVTIVAAINAVVVLIGELALGVTLAGTICLVTLLGA